MCFWRRPQLVVGCLIALLIAYGDAVAAEKCTFKISKFNNLEVQNSSGQRLFYKFRSISGDWEFSDFAFHNAKFVHRKNISGHFWLYEANPTDDRPIFASGFPSIMHYLAKSYKYANPKEPPRKVSMSHGFSGWLSRSSAYNDSNKNIHDIVIVVVSDGCATLQIRFETPPDIQVDEAFSDLSISKTDSE